MKSCCWQRKKPRSHDFLWAQLSKTYFDEKPGICFLFDHTENRTIIKNINGNSYFVSLPLLGTVHFLWRRGGEGCELRGVIKQIEVYRGSHPQKLWGKGREGYSKRIESQLPVVLGTGSLPYCSVVVHGAICTLIKRLCTRKLYLYVIKLFVYYKIYPNIYKIILVHY